MDTDQLTQINKFVEKNAANVKDISIFYDNIAFNPDQTKCGMFNSTELWSFSGTLIVTSLRSLATALKVVNKINIVYYNGWEKIDNALDFVMLLQNSNIKVYARSEREAKQIYRLTGLNVLGISENFDNLALQEIQ
jgi:urease accessory protein UreH